MRALALQALTLLLLATGGAVIVAQPAQAAATSPTQTIATSASLDDTPWGLPIG